MKRLLALALLALTTQAQHREEVTVEVVEVPVYVHVTGEPIEGLTRDRFELFVNGKAQPIEYFDAVDLAEPPAASAKTEGAPERDIRRRRLFLMMFDLVYSRAAALARAREAAIRLVAAAPPGDAFAVSTYSLQAGVRFLVPFTTDRAVVNRAIAQLRPSTANDPMQLRITESEREVIAEVGGGKMPAGAIEDPYTGGGEAMEDNRKQPLRRRIEDQVREYGTIASRLAQLEGQKHVVVFSEGFNPYLITDMAKGRRTQAPQANSHVIDMIQEMYGSFQASDTFLHAVDIAGLRHTFDPLMNDALNMLSSGTGGQFVHNANDIGGALDELQKSHSYSYILGFTPRGPKRGNNSIEVKVKDLPRGATVSYRRGFSGTAPSASIDNLLLADILTNDIPQHGIDTSLERSSGGVILTVKSSAWAGLKPGEKPEVLLYVFDDGVAVASHRLRLNAGAEHFNIPLDLERGQVVKAVVRAGDSLGFSRLVIAE